jgi:transcriptional regulator with XRE-family HTH domain
MSHTALTQREQFMHKFEDKAYRDALASAYNRRGMALQLRETRERRDWTQVNLGELAGMAQESISLLENPNYGKFTIRTLERLASALDVVLFYHFGTFGELADRMIHLGEPNLKVAGFEDVKREEAEEHLATTADTVSGPGFLAESHAGGGMLLQFRNRPWSDNFRSANPRMSNSVDISSYTSNRMVARRVNGRS